MARIFDPITEATVWDDRLNGWTGALIGYARVSTDDQDCASQVHELRMAGCTEIIQEHGSGADRRRPALARLLASIQAGETLVIVRLDRLARSVPHLLEVVENLKARSAGLRSLRDPVDTTSPGGRLALTIFGAIAEFERALIIERTRSGLAEAKRAGRLLGNPGLRTGDRRTIEQLAAQHRAASRSRTIAILGPWLAEIEASRPVTSWAAIAAKITAAGGPAWSGERLRRTWQRLQGHAG